MQIMVGRRRRQGQREPNGRAQREKVDIFAIAKSMPHRKDLPEAIRHDSKAESIFGRLLLNGNITVDQYNAGIRYRDIVMRYRAVMDVPSHNPASMSGVIIGPWSGGYILSQEQVAERRSQYSAAYEALESGAGNRGARAVAHAVVYERGSPDLAVLKCGLNVLLAHFRLTNQTNGVLRH